MYSFQKLLTLITLIISFSMTIKANRFTPQVMLSAPRRSDGVPNADGSLVLYSVSTYNFEDHKRKSEIRVLNAKTNESALVSESGSEPNWLDGTNVLLLVSGDEGKTKVVIGDVWHFGKSNYTAGVIDGPASSVKLASLDKDKYALAFVSQAKPDGTIFNPETATKPNSSGRVYNSLFVRHWDAYVTKNRNTIWYSTLSKSDSSTNSTSYSLSTPVNALKGSGLESPIPPFGGADNYDISATGIAFVAKDPKLNPATNTKSDAYYLHISDFSAQSAPKSQVIHVPGIEGASSSPVFSHDGKKLAFLQMRENGYESDKNQLFLVPDVRRPGYVNPLFPSPDGKGRWDRSPDSITWGTDDKTLYLTASDTGRGALFSFPSDPIKGNGTLPQIIVRDGVVGSVFPLSNGDLFASGSNMVDNSRYIRISSGSYSNVTLLSSNTRNGALVGLSRSQVSEIWFKGDKARIHAWVVKPSNFDSSKKYPLAYLIHGGPQGAWADSWSTRWNPALWAEQGYVVVAPNPTGSTGYGQALTDAIHKNWGGSPYIDLVKGFEYIENNLDYVDINNAVALGASYGGYMMNWIQGHPLGRRFKTLVTHDGVFSMTAQLASEEMWFPEHDLGGKQWDNQSSWAQWDPSRFTANWNTPHLIIHSELDYRLTMAEGLAAFNVLQDRGVESQFLTFPDENHWVLKPENSLLWHTVVFDWINKHVGLPKYTHNDRLAKKLLEDATQSL